MSSRRPPPSKGGHSDDNSDRSMRSLRSLRKPPRSSKKPRERNRSRGRGYSLPGENPSSRKRNEVTLLLCVYHTTNRTWSKQPFKYDPNRINDRELWMGIRHKFRDDIQKPWRRIFGFKKVVNIVPIGYSPNGVPIRTDPKTYPDAVTFRHAYHHPEHLRPDHRWVDWFTDFDRKDPSETNGLEFIEGLWAEKLGILAVIGSLIIVVLSIIWIALGGDLQTVSSVMGFVLTLVAAQIALAALYYQVALPNG